MTNKFRLLLVGGGLLAGLGACARAPYQYQPPAAASPAGVSEAGPQLLFLSFKMTAAPRRVELVRAATAAGQLNMPDDEETGTAYLTITQLDAQQKPCAAPVRVAHPLLRDMEYPAEASGTLERHLVSLPEAEFFVRVARQPAAVAVRVEETAPGVPTPLSTIFSLTLSRP